MDFKLDILPLKNIIFRTALRITLNKEEAEDIVQDILMKMWQKRDELENVHNLESFAITATRHLALDRKEKLECQNIPFEESRHDVVDELQRNAEESISEQEGQSYIESVINSLPEKQRMIIHLRDIEGKNYKEIAELLSISESDVKVSIFRARNEIKEKILKKKSLFL